MTRYGLFARFLIIGACLSIFYGCKETTPEERQLPTEMLEVGVIESLYDPEVRPQDDFYQWANGRWFDLNRLEGSAVVLSAFDETRTYVRVRVLRLVLSMVRENRVRGTRELNSNEKAIRRLYALFLNTARLDSEGFESASEMLDAINAVDDPASLYHQIGALARYHINTPILMNLDAIGGREGTFRVSFEQNGLSLPTRTYYLDNENFADEQAAYKTMAARVLAAFEGDDDPSAMNYAGRAEDVFKLERDLAEAQWTRAALRNQKAQENVLPADDVDNLLGRSAWRNILRGAGLNADAPVMIRQLDYFERLNSLVQQVPNAVWRDYLRVRVALDYSEILPARIRDASFDFFGRALAGVEYQAPRTDRGVPFLIDVLGPTLAKEYIDYYGGAQNRDRAVEVFEAVRAGFLAEIHDSTWLSPETREAAEEKLANMALLVGAPDPIIATMNAGRELSRANLFEMTRDYYALQFDQMFAAVNTPADVNNWNSPILAVNAYYDPTLNRVILPTGLLNPNFVHPDMDAGETFGALGAIIGHEIAHAFDDSGRHRNLDGAWEDWWTEAEEAEFERRADTFKAQAIAAGLDGVATLGENLSDSMGLQAAWRALQAEISDLSEAEKQAQYVHFFAAWAQTWRRFAREQDETRRSLSDIHGTSEFRVNGILSNQDGFYSVFGVEPGDLMFLTPDQRADIWR